MFDTKKDAAESRDRLADELAELKAQVKALRRERDDTAERSELRQQIETLKLSKDRLVEENDRKIRDTEHKVGLLKLKQDHEVANAKRETELSVREQNLSADKDRFKAEMDFQRERLTQEINRIDNILTQVLKRLPDVTATFTAKREETVPSEGDYDDEDAA